MSSKRYIGTKALSVNSVLVPVWNLEFKKSDMYGEYFIGPDGKEHYGDLIDAVWDCKKKRFAPFKVKEEFKSKFEVGEEVLVEVTSDSFRCAKILKVEFESFESYFKPVKKLDNYEKSRFSSREFNNLTPDELIEFRSWRPSYILEDGEIVNWEYKISKLVKDYVKD